MCIGGEVWGGVWGVFRAVWVAWCGAGVCIGVVVWVGVWDMCGCVGGCRAVWCG